MATLGLVSQHPGSFGSHKHYYLQQPQSPPQQQQHYGSPPPAPQPPQQQHQLAHMQPTLPHSHPQPPQHHYYHSGPASSFASSPSTTSYSQPNTSTAAYFLPPSKPYDGSAQHPHTQQHPTAHYYSPQPMAGMQPMQATAAMTGTSSTLAPAPSSHSLLSSTASIASSSCPAPSSSSSSSSSSSQPAVSHMVQVNGSQYVLSPVQPASSSSTPSYPVMLIPVAASSHQHDSSSCPHSTHSGGSVSSHSVGSSSGSSSGGMSEEERKARHIKTPQQMRVLKVAYALNSKPGKEEMKSLMKDTKCSYNEVCRWFRNERHKEKKINDGKVVVEGKTPPSASADAAASTGSTAEKTAAASEDGQPHSPSSVSLPSTPASSQPSSPQSSVGSGADGDRRLSAWLRVFTAEFTCEQQQAALRQLISRTRTLAESGNELENLMNGKRSRGAARHEDSDGAADTEDDEPAGPIKRQKAEEAVAEA